MDPTGAALWVHCEHAAAVENDSYSADTEARTRDWPEREIYAVIGGFHLTGGSFEPIIPATIAELKAINPRYVMPGHCTGWSATHQIARAMPEAYIPNSVGTMLIL